MSIRPVFHSFGLALLGTLTLAACGADVGSDAAFQTDSFANPTEHGELVFSEGARNEASFTETSRYHSWTFTLTDEATIDLQTDPVTVNLDTVLYLYGRQPGESNWGSYIRKNDNHDGEMYSRIETELGAGEYRIKVKATHERMVGSMNVQAQCDGAGCPQVEGGTCEPTYGSGTYTEGCGERIREIVMAPVSSESSTTMKYGERCNYPNVEAQAASAYRDYFGDWWDWDEYVGDDGDMYLTVRRHGDVGTVVSVDLGGDEDGVSFLFAADGKLLMFFHSEQSSSTWYSCGVDGEAQMTEPDTEECGQALLHDLAHSSEDTNSGTTTAASAAADLGAFVAAGVTYFADDKGLSDSEPIAYSLSNWDSGSELELTANGSSTTLLMADRWGDALLAMRIDDDLTRVMCEVLDTP